MGRSTRITLSALTTPGMIYGVWGNRNRMLGKDVFAILGTFFSPSSQSDVEKGFPIASRRFRYSAFPKRNIRGGTENMSTQEDESQWWSQHKGFCCCLQLFRTVPLSQNGVIGFLLLGVPGFRRPVYFSAQGRFFYPAFPRTAGGGTNHGQAG